MAVSEGKMCRAVIDRHDVIRNQVLSVVNELIGSQVPTETSRVINEQIKQIFVIHTNGLVANISKQFAEQ